MMDWTVAASATGILLREGLEAILVLTALVAYLRKIGNHGQLHLVWGGAGVGVLGSLVTAWLLARFNGGDHNDMVEGITMFVAAVLMLYVSGWMFLRQNPALWKAALKKHADRAAASGNGMALAGLAFLAVYREGAETALFINALAGAHGGWGPSLLGGIVAGFAGMGVLLWAIEAAAIRLPLRPMFAATSAFLFLMGLSFIGDGLGEFQEMGWVGYHNVPVISGLWPGGISAEALALMVFVGINAMAATAVVRGRVKVAV